MDRQGDSTANWVAGNAALGSTILRQDKRPTRSQANLNPRWLDVFLATQRNDDKKTLAKETLSLLDEKDQLQKKITWK